MQAEGGTLKGYPNPAECSEWLEIPEEDRPNFTFIAPAPLPFDDSAHSVAYQSRSKMGPRGKSIGIFELDRIGCTDLEQSALSTQSGTMTDTSRSAQVLWDAIPLRRINKCHSLTNNLITYTLGESNSYVINNPNNPPLDTTYKRVVGASPLIEDQLPHLAEIWHLFGSQMSTVSKPKVNSESSVQDQVRKQILDHVNCCIKYRYDPDKLQLRYNILPEAIYGQDASPVRNKHPYWDRACIANIPGGEQNETGVNPAFGEHLPVIPMTGTASQGQEQTRVRLQDVHNKPEGYGGIPDFLLIVDELGLGQVCLAEVKASWSFESGILESIFSNSASPQGFPILHMMGAKAAAGIKQIWTEMLRLRVDTGFWTNGDIVIVFLRTEYDTLTFSDSIFWYDAHLKQILTGLSYASIDLKLMLLTDRDGTARDSLFNSLAPREERNTNWNM